MVDLGTGLIADDGHGFAETVTGYIREVRVYALATITRGAQATTGSSVMAGTTSSMVATASTSSGSNVIKGSVGFEVLFGQGGADADTFVFNAGHGRDRIDDWQDRIELVDYSGHSGVTGIADLTIRSFGVSAVVEDGSGGLLVIAGAAGQIMLRTSSSSC